MQISDGESNLVRPAARAVNLTFFCFALDAVIPKVPREVERYGYSLGSPARSLRSTRSLRPACLKFYLVHLL